VKLVNVKVYMGQVIVGSIVTHPLVPVIVSGRPDGVIKKDAGITGIKQTVLIILKRFILLSTVHGHQINGLQVVEGAKK
jgi:hypothetical protein